MLAFERLLKIGNPALEALRPQIINSQSDSQLKMIAFEGLPKIGNPALEALSPQVVIS